MRPGSRRRVCRTRPLAGGLCAADSGDIAIGGKATNRGRKTKRKIGVLEVVRVNNRRHEKRKEQHAKTRSGALERVRNLLHSRHVYNVCPPIKFGHRA